MYSLLMMLVLLGAEPSDKEQFKIVGTETPVVQMLSIPVTITPEEFRIVGGNETKIAAPSIKTPVAMQYQVVVQPVATAKIVRYYYPVQAAPVYKTVPRYGGYSDRYSTTYCPPGGT